MSTPGNTGPPGRSRGIGFGILMFVVTLHFYSWYWVFKTQVFATPPHKWERIDSGHPPKARLRTGVAVGRLSRSH